MSRTEVKRLQVIQRVVDDLLTVREAAELLELSIRHTYRLKARYLLEKEGIIVSPSTARRILRAVGIKSARKRRSRKVYQPRQRKSKEGMLIQMDASKHAWV